MLNDLPMAYALVDTATGKWDYTKLHAFVEGYLKVLENERFVGVSPFHHRLLQWWVADLGHAPRVWKLCFLAYLVRDVPHPITTGSLPQTRFQLHAHAAGGFSGWLTSRRTAAGEVLHDVPTPLLWVRGVMHLLWLGIRHYAGQWAPYLVALVSTGLGCLGAGLGFLGVMITLLAAVIRLIAALIPVFYP